MRGLRRIVQVLPLVLACTAEPESSELGDGETQAESGTGETESETESGSETGETETEGDTDEPLEGYDSPDLWLCHPDKPAGDDHCLSHPLDVTDVAPDGTLTVIEHEFAVEPEFDCFYVYPTVDLRLTPGQTEDFADIDQELDPLLNQAAPFSAHCRMFAPLYHQVTFGTFGSAEAPALLDAAYADVEAAFESYRTLHMGDRPLVILGHSQGTYMTTRLLQEVIEPDPALRERLIVALLIGGSVSVPTDAVVGGTFSQLPLCETATQTGCVTAYRTYAAELPPGPGDQTSDGPGLHVACTDPVALLGSGSMLAGTDLPTFSNQPFAFPPFVPEFPVETAFVRYGELYRSECLTDVDGHEYLAITVEPGPGDTRVNPIDFNAPLFSPNILGLHVLDYNFPIVELLELVALKADSM